MIHSQMEKVVASVPTAAGTSDVTLVIDTLAWDHASVTVLRAANASTVFASALKIQHSDDGTAYSDVSGFVAGTDFTLGSADTANASIVKLDVNTLARKRYLKVLATPAVSVAMVATARLSRGENAPATASDAGVLNWVKG